MTYQINWEIQAIDLTAGFLSDDPDGIAARWDRVSQLADEPRPAESFPTGRRTSGACALAGTGSSTRSTMTPRSFSGVGVGRI